MGIPWLPNKSQTGPPAGGKAGAQCSYLDESLKHVSQWQEGDKAVIFVGENHFLQRKTGSGEALNKNKTDKGNTQHVNYRE